jgi:hypothetical protein
MGMDTVTFEVMPAPVVSAGTLIPVCNKDASFLITTKANATTTGTGGYWTYVPVSPLYGINNALRDSQHFIPSAVTIPTGFQQYSWKLVFTDISSGCPVSDTTTIIVAANPQVTFTLNSTNPVCKFTGVKMLTSTSTPSGGIGVYSSYPATSAYSADANPNKANFNTNDPTLLAGTYSLIYSYSIQVPSYSVQCKTADTTPITVNQPPVIRIGTRNLEKCASDTFFELLLDASVNPSPYNYKWQHFGGGHFLGGIDNTNNPIYIRDSLTDIPAKVIKIKVATLPANAGDPCPIASDSVNILIDPQPIAAFNCATCDGCEPLNPVLTALPAGVAVTYQWTINKTVRSTDSVYNIASLGWGNYEAQLIVTTGGGCTTTSLPKTIKVHSTPVAEFTANPWLTTVAKPYFDFTNKSTSPDGASMHYLWNFGPEGLLGSDRSSQEKDPQGIGYSIEGYKFIKLRATTEYGCWDTISYGVKIDPDITVFIPNAFHPHSTGDGVPCPDGTPDCNARFKLSASGFLVIEIYIFNRWGQQVYFSNDAQEGWNGNMDGKAGTDAIPCQQDVYIYQINATSFSGKAYKYSGSITLLR